MPAKLRLILCRWWGSVDTVCHTVSARHLLPLKMAVYIMWHHVTSHALLNIWCQWVRSVVSVLSSLGAGTTRRTLKHWNSTSNSRYMNIMCVHFSTWRDHNFSRYAVTKCLALAGRHESMCGDYGAKTHSHREEVSGHVRVYIWIVLTECNYVSGAVGQLVISGITTMKTILLNAPRNMSNTWNNTALA